MRITSEPQPAAAIAKKELHFWWWAVGTLIGSLSLISLLQEVLQSGLAPLPQLVLTYYRAALSPVSDLLTWIVPFKLPNWYADLYVLSFLSLSAFSRAHLAEKWQHKVSPAKAWAITLVSSALLSLLLFGLVHLFFSLVVFMTGEYRDSDPALKNIAHRTNKRYLISVLMLIISALAFFAWNHQSL